MEPHWGNGWSHSPNLWQFRQRFSCASSGIHHPCRLGCHIGLASVAVPLYLGPRPFAETRFCQAEIHIEESQGGGSGPIGLVKLPSYKEMCRQHKVMLAICSFAIWVCTKSLQQQILRIMLMAGSSIGVPCYADMFVARGRARLKARDGKVFELDGLLASIARNRSQFACFLYGFAWGQPPCGRPIGK